MNQFFNRVKIRTPESVELDFMLAGIGNRALALLIDYTVLTLVVTTVIALASLIAEQITNLAELLGGGTDAIEMWIIAILILLVFLLTTGYFVVFEILWQGQSPGKRVTQIRVISETGQPPNLFQATLRSLLRPVDDILFLGFLMIVLTRREKRIGDWIAGTLVVQMERSAMRKSLNLSDNAQAIAAQLQEMAQPEQISPDDFTVLREYLMRRSQLTPDAKSEVSLQLARHLKQVIQLDTLPGDMTPDAFLEAVYLAYQGQSSGKIDSF
jgi:uncharacterized RDD family membrane protein YckC